MENTIYLKVLLLAVLTAIPFIKEKGFKLYNPAILISIIYFVEFGIAALYMAAYPKDFYYANFEPKLISTGLNFILLVFLFFILGYYLPIYNVKFRNIMLKILKKIPDVNNYTIQIKNLPLILILLLFFGWLTRIILIKLGVYFHTETGEVATKISGFKLYAQYLNLGSLFPLVALALIFFEWLKTRQINFLIFSIILTLLEVVYALPSGSKERVAVPLFIVLAMYSLSGSKLPIVFLVSSIFFFLFFVFPFSTLYRLLYSGNMARDFQFALLQYWKLIENFDQEFFHSLLYSMFGERFNYVDVVSRVVNFTPQIWDFKLGYTYFLFFISLIPRIFWPGKPDIAGYGNQFGRDYGFNNPQDYTTSMDMSWVGEMFINFGWFGIFAAFLIGLFYQMIYSYFMRHRGLTALSIILYTFSLYTMTRGGMLAGDFAGLFKLYFVVLILFMPFLKKVNSK